MNPTRREILQGARVGILSAGAAGAHFLFRLPGSALAAEPTEPSTEELMTPGPLAEMSQGSPDAPVTVIEYASMTCTHCAAFAVKTYPELKSRYIDKGKVRYIMREFPLDPIAAAGFMLARSAGEGKYFDVIDLLFHEQPQWAFVKDPLGGLHNMGKQIGLSDAQIDDILQNQKLLDGIVAVRQRAAESFGVNSTPTFFVNGKVHRGDMPIDEMAKLIDPYLKNG